MSVGWTTSPTSGTPIVLGGVRQLTIGEIALAGMLFGGSIIYSKVWVHLESHLPFNMRPINVAMAPSSEFWSREGIYSPDSSLERDIQKKHRFIHEMVHAWQARKGMFARIRGLFSRFADYSYSLGKADLPHYGLEQQTSIVSDYWLLLTYGFNSGTSYLSVYRDYNPNESVYSLIPKYKAVIKGFPRRKSQPLSP